METGLTESSKHRDTVNIQLSPGVLQKAIANSRAGSLAFLPRKRAARHRGKVKRLVLKKSELE